MNNLAKRIDDRKREIETVDHVSEAAAVFAAGKTGDVMVIARFEFPEPKRPVTPGKISLAPIVSGMFVGEFLRRPVDILGRKDITVDGCTAELILCSRADYRDALHSEMLDAAFGKGTAKTIADGLKKRRGRVPVLRACRSYFRGVATVPADGGGL